MGKRWLVALGTAMACAMPGVSAAGNPPGAARQSGDPAGAHQPPALRPAARDAAADLVTTEGRRGGAARLSRHEWIVEDARRRLRGRAGLGNAARPAYWTLLGYTGKIRADDNTGRLHGRLFGGGNIGGYRRYAYGDIDIRYRRGFGTTVELTTALTFERQIGDRTLLGAFLGADAGNTRIAAELDGSVRTTGANVGIYGVRQLTDEVLVDAFMTVSRQFHRIDFAGGGNGVHGSYRSAALQFGASIQGEWELAAVTLFPEVEFRHRVRFRPDTGLRAQAGGHALRAPLAGGTRRRTTLSFAPKLVRYLDPEQTRAVTFSSDATCRMTRPRAHAGSCEAGLDVGYTSSFAEGRASFAAEADLAEFGGYDSRGVELELSYAF